MPLKKATFIFGQGNYGWSESHWFESDASNLEVDWNFVIVLAQKRSRLLGKEAYIKAVRVSDETVVGDSYLGYTNLPGDAQAEAGPPDDTVLVVFRENNNKRHRHVFMRGIFDGVADKGGNFAPQYLPFAANWPPFVAEYVNGRYGYLGVNTAQRAKRLVGGYVENANGTVTVTAAGPLFPADAVGKVVQVRMAGINGGSPLNGQQIVVASSTTTFTTAKPLSVFPYRFGGTVSYAPKEFIRTPSISPQKIVSRKVGSPLLVSRGRQPVRARG